MTCPKYLRITLKALVRSSNEFDTTYGPHCGLGHIMMGNSHISFDDNFMVVRDSEYYMTLLLMERCPGEENVNNCKGMLVTKQNYKNEIKQGSKKLRSDKYVCLMSKVLD